MNGRAAATLTAFFHTLIIGTYVPIQLYVANLSVVPITSLWVPTGLALAGTVALIFAAWTVFESPTARGVVVSWLCLGLMPMLAVQRVITSVFPVAEHPYGKMTLVVFYTVAIAVAAVAIAKHLGKSTLTATRDALNALAAVLLLMNLVGAGTHLFTPWRSTIEALVEPVGSGGPRLQPQDRPDIYYIILDGYGRDDVLAERYQFATNSLTTYLSENGFYVAHRSRANYLQTYLSLASSLNMVYLDPLARTMKNADRRPLAYLIDNSVVVSELKSLGYTTVLVSSDYYATTGMSQVDVCLCDTPRPTDFEAQLLARTPFGAIPSVVDAAYSAHRRKVTGAFETLRRPIPGTGPRFVFAHVIAPHPPFVFGPDGEPRQPSQSFSFSDGSHFPGGRSEYVAGYRDQLSFVNGQLESVIDSIKDRTHGEAVIVVQSDHGPGSALDWESVSRSDLTERSGILSAYYLPGFDQDTLYDTVSPVNTFRLIFNRYFQTDYDRLPDRTYFSSWPEPYRFVEVPLPLSADSLGPSSR